MSIPSISFPSFLLTIFKYADKKRHVAHKILHKILARDLRSFNKEYCLRSNNNEWLITLCQLCPVRYYVEITWTAISIFMADMIATTWPFSTGSPTATLISMTSPFMGDPTLPGMFGSILGWLLVQVGPLDVSRIRTDLKLKKSVLSNNNTKIIFS